MLWKSDQHVQHKKEKSLTTQRLNLKKFKIIYFFVDKLYLN